MRAMTSRLMKHEKQTTGRSDGFTGTILLTAFGPFPGAPFNPSGPLVRKLAYARRPAFADMALVGHIFPTSYHAVDKGLPALLKRFRPDAVLMFGLSTRSRHIRIETQARNTLSAFPDASGKTATTSTIERGTRSRLPIRAPRAALLRAARASRIPARLSRDAGRYLCNYLYWRALEAAAQPGGPRVVAFIHIPNVRQNIRRRSHRPAFGDLHRMGEAVLAAVVAALNRPRHGND